MSSWFPAAGLTGSSVLVLGLVSLWPTSSDRIFAVFPPHWPEQAVIAAATAQGARLVDIPGVSFAPLVELADGATLDDLRNSGVILMVRATGVGGCL